MIYVLGIGPGDSNLLLNGSQTYWQASDYIVGSQRQLEILPMAYQEKAFILPKSLTEFKNQLHDWQTQDKKVTVLASGDPLLYGIGNYLRKNFSDKELQIIPGISSMQYIFTQIDLAMNDTYFTSSHGKQPDFDLLVQLNQIAMVTDDKIGPYEIAQEFCKRGAVQAKLYIGENLSYPNQKISIYSVTEVPKINYEMNVVVISNER